jgi:hypothetical protein
MKENSEEVNYMSNVMTIEIKGEYKQHGDPTNANVGSGAMEESRSSADLSYPLCIHSQNSVYGIIHCESRYGNESLTKVIKQTIQHMSHG